MTAITQPPQPAHYGKWPAWMPTSLRNRLAQQGITQPYIHQITAAEHAHNGQHVIIATGTSSGKSLGYQLPILSALSTEPHACALYITPTKALGHDQLLSVLRLGLVDAAPYDGDTPTDARTGIREKARYVVTNPDMLHTGILPNHAKWQRFLRNLRFIVIDEAHHYRGVFGAHVSLVLHRLLRLARRYGAEPTVILASATIHEPAEHAARLIGSSVVSVVDDGAPHGKRVIELRESEDSAAVVMGDLLRTGLRTLAFVKSRAAAEVLALRLQEEFGPQVAAYRSGYLAEDRRAIEQALDSGELLGVATTSALELGIDIGGLDAVVIVGFPGTVASFWQQAGRAGRRGQDARVVFVAGDDPLDTYLVHHPAALLGRPVEASVFDPTNPHVLAGHVMCAALEAPLTAAEVTALGATEVVERLVADGYLRLRPKGYFAVREIPAVSLRGGQQIMIVEDTGRMLGTIDAGRAHSQVHPGAVYLHQGESYVVSSLDADMAVVKAALPDYYTQARSVTDIRVVAPDAVAELPGVWVSNVVVEVTRQVVGYVMKDAGGAVIGMVPLDSPPQSLVTRAVAFTVDPSLLVDYANVPGALHAAEHALIGMLPLLATCDRWDVGGVSTALHPDTGLPTVFVYDGYPGGAGFADCAFRCFGEWVTATLAAVSACECAEGCPACVQSPKCGNGNNPLDKQGAIDLLRAISQRTGGSGDVADGDGDV